MHNKKAAIELSIGTIVVIVLAMSMLILGLVLIRTIFKGSTESVDTINEKVTSEIASLFQDEGEDVVVKLGSDHTARVKPDSGDFGIAIGARPLDGGKPASDQLKYKLVLDASDDNNCVKIIGQTKTAGLFKTSVNSEHSFDQISGSTATARIIVNIPKGTKICTQKVRVVVTDKINNEEVGVNFFVVEILKESLF